MSIDRDDLLEKLGEYEATYIFDGSYDKNGKILAEIAYYWLRWFKRRKRSQKSFAGWSRFQAETIFLLFCHCSYCVNRHRGVVYRVWEVHFDACIEPELFRAVPRGLAKKPRGFLSAVFIGICMRYVDAFHSGDFLLHFHNAIGCSAILDRISGSSNRSSGL